mgnify:CR=1 FL=1
MLCHLPFDASKRLFSPVLSSSRSRPCSSPRSPQLIGGADAGGEAPDDGNLGTITTTWQPSIANWPANGISRSPLY